MSAARKPADRDAPTKRALAMREGSARARRRRGRRQFVPTGACYRRARVQDAEPSLTAPAPERQPNSGAAVLAQAAAFKSP